MRALIGLTGYAGSGKDTVARMLAEDHGFARYAFADPLRAVLLDVNPWISGNARLADLVRWHGWDRAKREYHEVRRLMQAHGEAVRQHVGANVWINALERRMGAEPRVVVSDVRYPNEAAWIRQRGGRVIRIVRPGVGPVNGHASEQPIPHELVDFDLYNVPGNLGMLRDSAADLVEFVDESWGL